MGLVYADIELANADDLALVARSILPADQARRATVRANVDSGAHMLCVNEEVESRLGLRYLETQLARFADESLREVRVVGPIQIRFGDRQTHCNALVLPKDSEVLLGSIPKEDLDVVILPREQRLAVNPASPDMPSKPVKGHSLAVGR